MSTRFWKKYGKVQDRDGTQLKFEDLMLMLNSHIRILSTIDPLDNCDCHSDRNFEVQDEITGNSTSYGQLEEVEEKKMECKMCLQRHPTSSCHKLWEASMEQRVRMVKDRHLCFRCLEKQCASKNCKNRHRIRCRIDGCGDFHNEIFHGRKLTPRNDATTSPAPGSTWS